MNRHEPDELVDARVDAFARVLRDDVERGLEQARRSGRLDRVAGIVASSASRRGVLRVAPRWAWLSLLGLLVGGAVFAGLTVVRGQKPRPVAPSAATALPMVAQPPVIEPVAATPAPAATATPPAAPPAARVRSAVIAAETAAALFARANEARRAGHYGEAVRLYGRLQENLPGDAESNLSRVSLARLLLDRGQELPRALRLFEQYLTHAPDGTLAEQALAGRALALGKLGRGDDERLAWQKLLHGFPDSAHAALARERLRR